MRPPKLVPFKLPDQDHSIEGSFISVAQKLFKILPNKINKILLHIQIHPDPSRPNPNSQEFQIFLGDTLNITLKNAQIFLILVINNFFHGSLFFKKLCPKIGLIK